MRSTSESRFVPLRIRHHEDAAEPIELLENVAPHLFGPLAQWCHRSISQDSWWKPRTQDQSVAAMCLDLHIQRSEFSFGNEIESLCRPDPDLLLDIVDWILHPENRSAKGARGAFASFAKACIELEEVLYRGGSAWQVADPPHHLMRRVPAELLLEYQRATNHDDPVSEHLRDAWSAAWRHGDPSVVVAYDGAVKAIEGALIPIVIPNDPTATLGKVLTALRAKPAKWSTRFRGESTVSALTAVLDALWKTHARHAQVSPNSLDQAQDAVTIAVAIVALAERGFIAPTATPQPPSARSQEQDRHIR